MVNRFWKDYVTKRSSRRGEGISPSPLQLPPSQIFPLRISCLPHISNFQERASRLSHKFRKFLGRKFISLKSVVSTLEDTLIVTKMSKPNQVCVEQRCEHKEGEPEQETERVGPQSDKHHDESGHRFSNLPIVNQHTEDEDSAEEIPHAQQRLLLEPEGSNQDTTQGGNECEPRNPDVEQFDLEEASGEQFKKCSGLSSASNTLCIQMTQFILCLILSGGF